MAFNLTFGSKSSVGIDIGSNSIKVLKLSKSGHKYRIDDFDVIGLPSGAVSNGVIDDAASVASYIKSSFSRLGIKEKNVVIAVPCKHIIIKTIEMPKMKGSDLSSSMYYEAQQYISYDINEVFYDYVVLGESKIDPNNNMIMIIAGKKDIINNQTGFIRECGLNPFIVDVDCIAVENMFNFNYPEEYDELVALVGVGASETNVHVMQNGLNLFRRDIPIGGVNITEEIAKKFQIDFNEAENIKTGDGDIDKNDADFQTNYAIYLNMIITRITSEIQRTIDYFAANNDKQYPSKIYLTGGSSSLSGLADGIEKKLNISVEDVNPFRGLLFKDKNMSVDSFRRLFGTAVGLALRGLE